MGFHLEPVDVLISQNERGDPYSRIKRWALGSSSEHVFTYLGKLGLYSDRGQASRIIRVPMLFESMGRGVVLRNLSERYDEKVVVMRLKSEHDRKRIPDILLEAIKLASYPQSYYDYLCIFKYILPRLICERLGLPMPFLKWHRNPWHICSEAVFEVFYRAKLTDILPSNQAPLPDDFLTSPLLEQAWVGNLTEEIVVEEERI